MPLGLVSVRNLGLKVGRNMQIRWNFANFSGRKIKKNFRVGSKKFLCGIWA